MQTTDVSAATLQLGPSAQAFQQSAQSARSLSSIEQAAQEFEAIMLTAMLKPVFESLERPAPFGGGAGERAWQGLLVEEYTKEIAASGGIGIADQVRAELMRQQEAAQQDYGSQ